MKNNTCFVISPIGDEASEIRKQSDLLYNYIIKPIVEKYNYSPLRADLIHQSGSITTQIIDNLVNSPLVIADLTEYNPNVFYELAIRHITQKPYIQMIKSIDNIPFDIYDKRTIKYDIDLENADKAKNDLEKQIQSIKNNDFKPDNPITQKHSTDLLKKIAEENTNYTPTEIPKILIENISELNQTVRELKNDIKEINQMNTPHSLIYTPTLPTNEHFSSPDNLRFNHEPLTLQPLTHEKEKPGLLSYFNVKKED